MFADKGLEGAQDIKSVCTQYVADTVINQLRLAVKYDISSKSEDQYLVTSKGINIYDVNVVDNQCSYSFRSTLMMPCCHIFAVRHSLSIGKDGWSAMAKV